MMWPKRRNRDHSARESGQSLVEFALILPVLVLILMGVFDFGRAFFAYNAISNGAREGARYGVIHPTRRDSDGLAPYDEENTIEEKAAAQTFILDMDEIDIQVTFPSGTDQRGDPITVTVTYDFRAITPLIGDIIGNPLTLQSSATMIIEQSP